MSSDGPNVFMPNGVQEAMQQQAAQRTAFHSDESIRQGVEQMDLEEDHQRTQASEDRRPETINAVVVNQDVAPVYTGNSRQELAAWYAKAKIHRERRSEAGCLIPWRTLISHEKLCFIANYGFEKILEVSLLTDGVLEGWIQRELDVSPKDSVYQITSALTDLKMEFTPGCPLTGVEKFFQSFEDIIQKHRLNEVRKTEEGQKKFIKMLRRAIRPLPLQEMMRTEIEHDPEVEKDLRRFYRKLKEFAIMYDRVAICQKQVNKFNGEKKAKSGFFPKEDSRKSKENGKETQNGQKGQKRPHSDVIDAEKGKNVTCFNCKKKGHPKRLCPDLSSNNKKAKDSQYIAVYALNLDSDQSVFIQLGSEIRVPAILDSGANQVSLIPRHFIDRLIRAQSKDLKLEKLDVPVLVKLGDNQSTIEVQEVVTLDITLITRTGQLLVKDRRFLVWNIPGDEVIIGSDILRSLCIYPYNALDALTGSQQQQPKYCLTDLELNDIKASIAQAFDRIRSAGLDSIWVQKLQSLLLKYADVFRNKMGADLPAKVTPFVTRLKSDAKPYKCKPRKYSPEQSQFLKDFTDQLVQNGLVYENLNAEWASPVVVVKKEGGGHRMCVDLRAVNAMSESTVWPMPFLESIVTHLGNSKYWFKLDAFKGFWLMPLAEECQEMFSFMTDRGVFTPRRSIQGALNSAIQFQSRMHEVFKELIFSKVIIWIDDLMGHASNLQSWFDILTRVLYLASQFNIKFNIDKCDFFTTKVKYCGRIFSTEGVSHDPERVKALTEMSQPKTARDLQQFLMAAQWMSRSIPEYNAKVYSLQLIYEKAMKHQPARTKTIARQVRLAKYGWEATHALAFEQLKQAIVNHVRLAYPQKNMVQCLYTDANECNSSAVVTQIPVCDLDKHLSQQRHEPLGFCGHKFTGSQLNWSIVEKEGFAVVDALNKLDYLLTNQRPFRLYVDHKNLLQIFSPTSVSKPVAQKLQRWALQIQRFNYEIHYITGTDNVWSDLMTRWGAAPVEDIKEVRALRISSKRSVAPGDIPDKYRVKPLHKKDFIWPSEDEIRKLQEEYLGLDDSGSLVKRAGKIVIPDQATDLKIRLCIIAHSGGNNGHIGYQAALQKLKEYFDWLNMTKDIKLLCTNCLHCLPTRGGKRIPRPLGEAIHGQYPNHVLHMDWIYIMPAERDAQHKYQWNLIMRDDLSGYIRITPAVVPDSLVTVDALMEWRAASRTPKILVTDMASYFMSNVMKEFTQRCNLDHHLTVAYGHYSNGSIEVINRNYLMLIRALISELHWNKTEWPWLNKNIEHTINHRPQTRLGGKAPVTVFTGQSPDNPFDPIFGRHLDGSLQISSVPPDKIREQVQNLENSLAQMHKQIVKSSKEQRQKKRIQPQIYRREPNFIVGDYVLVGDPVPSRSSSKKLNLLWKGPYRVTDTRNNYIFELENILDGVKKVVHGDRIRYYSDNQLNITEEIKDQFAYDSASYEVEQFKGCRVNPQTHQLELLVNWKGFTEDENSWEPLQNLWKDVPALVQNYNKFLKQIRHELADMVLEQIRKWTFN